MLISSCIPSKTFLNASGLLAFSKPFTAKNAWRVSEFFPLLISSISPLKLLTISSIGEPKSVPIFLRVSSFSLLFSNSVAKFTKELTTDILSFLQFKILAKCSSSALVQFSAFCIKLFNPRA